MRDAYHYPPELLNLLVDTVPLLCRSKLDVIVFFQGAAVPPQALGDLADRVDRDRESISKYEIARTTLVRLNELGDPGLRARREVLKRTVEFEDFSSCWPDDQLKAQGLVAQIRDVVNVKDSFTRMAQEREKERRARAEEYRAKVNSAKAKKEKLDAIRRELFSLFALPDPQERGLRLEAVLNDLFDASGIHVRESFRRVGEDGEGILEQIDGVIELDGHVYLVEVKWLSRSVGSPDVAQHLVRVYGRGGARGLFISATEFTDAAISQCRDALQQRVVVLSMLREFVQVIERNDDLAEFLRRKSRSAVMDKRPYVPLY